MREDRFVTVNFFIQCKQDKHNVVMGKFGDYITSIKQNALECLGNFPKFHDWWVREEWGEVGFVFSTGIPVEISRHESGQKKEKIRNQKFTSKQIELKMLSCAFWSSFVMIQKLLNSLVF